MPKTIPTTPYVYSMFAQDTADWLHLPQDEEAFLRIFAMNAPAKQRKAAPKKEPKKTPKEEEPNEEEIKEEDIKEEEPKKEKHEEHVAERDDSFDIPMTRKLFDAFVDGFEGVDIHGDGGAAMDVKLGAWNVASALLSCITTDDNEDDDPNEITIEDVVAAWDKIKLTANLTDKANRRWTEAWTRAFKDYNSGSGCFHWGGLITAMRTFNPTYYESNIKPLLRAASPVPFEEDTYTFTDFDRDAPKLRSLVALYKALSRCVAIHLGKGYIVRTLKDGKITNECVSRTTFQQNYKINVEYRPTEAEKQKMKDNHHAVKDTISSDTYKLVISPKFKNYATKYKDVSIMSNDKEILSMYRPPAKTQYKPDLIEEWMQFYYDVLYNEEPFTELLDSLAARFRNPNTFIEKFFINYGKGHNGKSFLTYCLSLLFPNYSNVAVQLEQIENDMFNAWLTENLLVWLEEAQQTNYQTKNLDQRIKQLTTKTISVRGMQKQTRSARNWAIMGMNTNSKDLYGLVRGDEALIERLVILHFKDDVDRKYIDTTCATFANDPCFAYSLWYYLMYEHPISDGFSPVRYHGKEKREFIQRAKVEAGNSVIDWLLESHDEVFAQRQTIKGINYRVARERDVNSSYDYYKRSHPNQKCIQRPKDTLMQYNFLFVKTTVKTNDRIEKGVPMCRITEDNYNSLIERLTLAEDDGEILEINDNKPIVEGL